MIIHARLWESSSDRAGNRGFELTRAIASRVCARERQRPTLRLHLRGDACSTVTVRLHLSEHGNFEVVLIGARESLSAAAIDEPAERNVLESLVRLEPRTADDVL